MVGKWVWGGGYPPPSLQEADIKVKAGQVKGQPWRGVEGLPDKGIGWGSKPGPEAKVAAVG